MNWKVIALSMAILVTLRSPGTAGLSYQNNGKIAPTVSFTGQGGDVMVYFYGDTASYHSDLTMYVNGVQTSAGYVLPNHNSTFGEAYNLGYAPLGSNIVFALQVFGNNPVTLDSLPDPHYVGTPIYTVYSDPSLNTLDHINHVYSTPYTLADSNVNHDIIPTGTYVGFEDELYNVHGFTHSDLNYNDHDFVFTDVDVNFTPTDAATELPEPASASLLCIGALCLAGGFAIRKLPPMAV